MQEVNKLNIYGLSENQPAMRAHLVILLTDTDMTSSGLKKLQNHWE